MTEDLQPVFEHEVLLGSVVCADAGASEALRSRVIDGLVRFVKNPEMHAEGLQMKTLTQDSSEPEKIVFHRSLQAGKVSFEDRVTVTQDAVIFDVSRQQALPASRLTVRLIEREGVFLLRFSYEGEPGQKSGICGSAAAEGMGCKRPGTCLCRCARRRFLVLFFIQHDRN